MWNKSNVKFDFLLEFESEHFFSTQHPHREQFFSKKATQRNIWCSMGVSMLRVLTHWIHGLFFAVAIFFYIIEFSPRFLGKHFVILKLNCKTVYNLIIIIGSLIFVCFSPLEFHVEDTGFVRFFFQIWVHAIFIHSRHVICSSKVKFDLSVIKISSEMINTKSGLITVLRLHQFFYNIY